MIMVYDGTKNRFRFLKKTIFYVVIVSVLFFTSCKFVLKKYYGIRNPKVETEESLRKYLKRKGINSNNVYTVSYKDYKDIMKQIGGIPEILIFDKNGRNIIYKEEGQCNAYAFNFIEELSKDIEFKYNDSLRLDDYFSKLKDFEGNPVTIKKDESADFYLFIFWTRYSGRLNKDHVKVWEEQAINNKKSKIKVIKVNLDMQKWWEQK